MSPPLVSHTWNLSRFLIKCVFSRIICNILVSSFFFSPASQWRSTKCRLSASRKLLLQVGNCKWRPDQQVNCDVINWMCNLNWRQKKKGAAEEIVEMVINSKDMNLRKLWEIMEERRAWSAAGNGFTKSQTQLSEWMTTPPWVQNDDHSVMQLRAEGGGAAGGERKFSFPPKQPKDRCVLFFSTYKCNSWEIISMEKKKSLCIYQ